LQAVKRIEKDATFTLVTNEGEKQVFRVVKVEDLTA
jgi:hypothetical protein